MTDYIPEQQWDGRRPTRGESCIYCDKPVLARQLCSAHYNRWWRRGTVRYHDGSGSRTDLWGKLNDE